MRRTVALIVGVTMISACGVAPPTTTTSPGARPAAPAFNLRGLDGKLHRLDEYKGKVVLVNFWATWCIPCRAEMPDLEHEYRLHGGDLVLLGLDYEEAAEPVAQFIHELGVTYPVLLDSDGKVHDAYRVGGLPTTFVLDRQGRVVSNRVGIADRNGIEAEYRRASTGP